MKLAEETRNANFRERRIWENATAKKTDFDKPKTLLKTRNLIFETQNADLKHKPILKTAKGFYAKFLPTACVTCAGAGTAKPSNQKNDKA